LARRDIPAFGEPELRSYGADFSPLNPEIKDRIQIGYGPTYKIKASDVLKCFVGCDKALLALKDKNKIH
jgi:hypothetical protein